MRMLWASTLPSWPYCEAPVSYPLPPQNEFFGQMCKGLTQELCRNASIKVYEPGEWLWEQGDPAEALHIILQGTVSLWAKPVGSAVPKDGRLSTSASRRSRNVSRSNSRGDILASPSKRVRSSLRGLCVQQQASDGV